MLNLLLEESGLIVTCEYPTNPLKVNQTDKVISIDDKELEKVILDNIGYIYLNVETLEYTLTEKPIGVFERISIEELNQKILQQQEVIDQLLIDSLGGM